MHPDQRAGDASAHAQRSGLPGYPAEHRPDEGALTLLLEPGVEVIRDQGKAEAHLLCAAGLFDKSIGPVLFAGEAES
jgi:hypothetical protein